MFCLLCKLSHMRSDSHASGWTCGCCSGIGLSSCWMHVAECCTGTVTTTFVLGKILGLPQPWSQSAVLQLWPFQLPPLPLLLLQLESPHQSCCWKWSQGKLKQKHQAQAWAWTSGEPGRGRAVQPWPRASREAASSWDADQIPRIWQQLLGRWHDLTLS